MEADSSSAADIGASLMFDFDFDDEVHLLDNPHPQAQASQPAQVQQQDTTMVDKNFSHENVDQMGSSSSSNLPASNISKQQKLTTCAHTNSEDLDSSLENDPNLAPQRASPVNPNPVIGTKKACNPAIVHILESSEAGEKKNKALVDQAKTNGTNDNNLPGKAHFSQDSSNQPLAASGPVLSPSVSSSFNTPLSGAPPAQPYLPTMYEKLIGKSSNAFQSSNSSEHVELGSSAGSNQSFMYNASSSQKAQNLMGSTYLGFTGTDPSLGNVTNVQQNKSHFFQSPLSGAPQQYPPTTVEMIRQCGGVSSFNSNNGNNSKNSNQLNTARSENAPQNELLPPQGMNPLNQSTTACADQLAQCVGDNDFHNSNQQALPNPTSFPQSSTTLGVVNQQTPAWFSNQNSPCTPLSTPSRPQVNRFLSPYVFEPQSDNSVAPGSSVPIRPQNSASNQLQQLNPVPTENVLNPQCQYSTMPEPAMLVRPQQLQSLSNQVLPLASSVQEPQGSTNPMLLASSLPLSMRHPQFLHFQQLNHAAGTADLSNLQFANSTPTINSLLSRTQQSSDDRPSLSLGPVMPNMLDPQRDNSLLLRPSTPSGAHTFDLQGLLNQTTRPGFAYPIPGSSSQLSQLFNSSSQRDIFGGHNSSGVSAFPQLELYLNRNDSFLGRRSRTTSIYDDLGESSSSSSSKRPKTSNFLHERGSSSQSGENNEGDNLFLSDPFNTSRSFKNTLYDPIFENLGLPIDPHLRLFNKK